MDARSGTAVARLVRQALAWRNPLAGSGDRLEGAVAITALVMTLLALPVAAALGSEVYARQPAISEQEVLGRHQVDAVLLAGTPSSVGGNAHNASVARFAVPATWTLPDGTTYRGEVEVPSDVPAGREVRTWVDHTGSRIDPPLTAEGAVLTAVMAAVGSWFALSGLMAALHVLVRFTHTRLRSRRWELEWAAVEPGWRKLA